MDKLMFGCCRGGMSSAATQMMLSSIRKAEKEGHQVLIIDPEREYQNLMTIGKVGNAKKVRVEDGKLLVTHYQHDKDGKLTGISYDEPVKINR